MVRLACWCSCFALLVLGCGSDVEGRHPGESDPDVEPTACGGQLGREPRALTTVGDGWLFVEGDDLIHVARYGDVSRIDRCTGEREVLAIVSGVSSAAVRRGSVYLVEPVVEDVGQLVRVDFAEGEYHQVSEIPPEAELVAHDEGVYYVASGFQAVDFDTAIFRVDEAEGAPVVHYPLDSWNGVKQFSLIGAGDAGLYYKASYDCGCNPGLSLVPFDGSEPHAMEDTAGAWSVAPVGGDLFVAVDLDSQSFGEMTLDIVSMPLGGGPVQVLVPANEEHTTDVRQIAANASAVCWTGYAKAPRCLRLDAPTASVRALDLDGSGYPSQSLVMAADAAYWMTGDEPFADSGYVVWGAVP